MSDFKPFIISMASAGSGKTFTLVREYLRFALAGDEQFVDRNFRRILAITFTNKAANEMKVKLMEALDELADTGSGNKKSDMRDSLLPAINKMAAHQRQPLTEADLRSRATVLRSAILHRYSDLSVSTIDSFMHSIVRTFAHDLGRPVNFEVRIEQDDLIEQAVTNLMSLVGTEGHDDLTRAVADFAVSRMEQERAYGPEYALKQLARQLFSEDAEAHLALLREYTLDQFVTIYKSYTAENHRFGQQLKSLGSKALSLIASAGMDESVCNQGNRGFLSFFRKVAAGSVENPNSYTVNVFEAADYSAASLLKAKARVAAAEAVAQPLREIYFELKQLLDEQLPDYNTRKVLLANLDSVALLGELSRCMQQYQQENEVIHLSEFNKLINSVVREQEAPFIYERLGSRYNHILIDEFQDTSILQWQNLAPLLANGVSQNQESLVVGDPKQAIYRFRQGDVRQFLRLPAVDGMPEVSRTLARARFEPLDTNYRTRRAIVNFNNDFFSKLVRNCFLDNELSSKSYLEPNPGNDPEKDSLRQKVSPQHQQDPEGYVSVEFLDGKESDVIPPRVLEIIRDLVDNQGYSYGDIMILGRSNKKLAEISAYLLENSDVRQNSQESFFLRGSHAVMALVAALRCLADPTDRIAAADLLVRLQRIGIVGDMGVEDFLSPDTLDLRRLLASQGIDFNPAQLLSLDLYDLCEHLLRNFRLDGIDTPYVASLLNRAASFSARNMQSVSDFLQWFDDHDTLSAACSDAGDAVRLLTIHKAKGLEAPVVICPIFTPGTNTYDVWVDVQNRLPSDGIALPTSYVKLSKNSDTRFNPERDREQADSLFDELNVLYVALTRPRERLYTVCSKPGSDLFSFSRMLASQLAGDSAKLQPRYEFGDPDSPCSVKKNKNKEPKSLTISRLSFPDWTSLVRVASASERAVTPLLDDQQRFGTYAHELLADIQHAADVDAAIARFLRRQPAGVTETDLHRLADLARDVVSNPLTERFFRADYQVKNECTIYDGTHEYRPDRIVITPDETWVVDFKTGKDLGVEHDAQVSTYCRLLSAMGYPHVSGCLLYFMPSMHLRPVP